MELLTVIFLLLQVSLNIVKAVAQDIGESAYLVCSPMKCKAGSATLDNISGLCVCPVWSGEDVSERGRLEGLFFDIHSYRTRATT